MDQHSGGESVGREDRLSEGVYLRRTRDGKPNSLRIAFQYRGDQCRERLRGLAPTPPNQRYAVRLRGEILNAIARGTFNYADFFPRSKAAKRYGFVASDRLVNALLDDYEKVTRKAVEASTWAGYEKIVRTRLRPWFGTTAVRDLTPGLIEEKFLAANIVLKTARNIRSVFNMVLRRAVATRELASNPLAQVDLEIVWPLERRRSDWRPDPFTFDEMEAIFGACDEEEADYWRVAFGTGMRPSEQIALQWPRVDFGGMRLRVEEARVLGMNGSVLKDHAKTPAGNRWIPFTLGASEALGRQWDRTGESGGIAFLDPRYEAPWASEAALRKRFARICTAAGVRYRNPYQTRHTFASTLLAAGHQPLRVAAWMGHEGPEMLYRHYGRWIEQGSDTGTRAALASFFAHPSPTAGIVVPIQGVA